MLPSHDHERAEQLLSEALSLPGPERIPFLTNACADDIELRTELLSLLEHAEPAEKLFDTLAELAIPDLPPPSLQAGRFEIMECIGVGGMGAVYRARDARLERDVALKFVPGRADVDGRLLQEARAVAALEHPNICTVHEIAETADGRSFIAMTLYDGETLRERLTHGPLTVGDALEIAIQVARGLSAAHAQGVVHRDIKPGNIMVTSGGTVKLLDFGLATTSKAGATAGAVPGTIPYMSPEQIRGETPGPQSDLWSLGVVIYEMLTGGRPFSGREQADRIEAILNETPKPLRSIDRRIPVALERMVARLLERDAAARYGTADELLRDLTHAQAAHNPPPVAALLQSTRARLFVLAGIAVLLLGGALVWRQIEGRAAGAGDAETKSIAVLPFQPAANDTAQHYLADGLREELTTVLSRLQALRVAGHGSVARFREDPPDFQTIGRALRVSSVLTGNVRRFGDSIRVLTELYSTADGSRTWANTYQLPLSNIVTLHNDVALRVATALNVPLSAAERSRLTQGTVVNSEAFAFYLRGRYFWNQRTASAYARAIEYFERALAQDSLFAPAYAGLASVYLQLGMSGQRPVAESAALARAAALRAVALADNSAEAHAVLALYLHGYAWDSQAAEREFKRALELDPGHPMTHQYYSTFLRSLRRFDEAIAHGKRAVELDPLMPGFSETLAFTLLRAGRTEAALQQIRSALELDSTYWRAHAVLGAIYENTQRSSEAIRQYQRANQLAGSAAHRTTADLARVLAVSGQAGTARQLLDSLRLVAARSGTYEAATATVLHALGEDDAAFQWLETAYQQRQPHLRFLDGDPRYAALARDARFNNLMQRIGVRH
jgi:TolB-like protein/Tfp pilus assembly protein PilF